ncbi:MAG: hypothetical protein QOG49_1466, partial [Frankiaceae bacterium]|nr:hypothetical protein [Frankiaceae bacterium]
MVANKLYSSTMTTTERAKATRPPDRRVRKTRASLHAAMLDLLSEHEYAGITVEQIIRRADVVRATFYAHVADKDELFRDVVSELTSSLVEDASAVAPVESFSLGGAAVYQLFRHAERYPHVYVPMIRGAAEGIPLALFRTALVAGYLNLLRTQESALE